MDTRKDVGSKAGSREVEPQAPRPAGAVMPWMDIAHKELGTAEIRGAEDNARIIEYHAATTLRAQEDEVPWCAAFVCWVLEQAGYQHPRSARALAFATSDALLPCDGVKVGAVAVLKRKGGGHVGFVVGVQNSEVLLLGGNQGDRVSIRAYPINRVVAYRWPVRKQSKEVV